MFIWDDVGVLDIMVEVDIPFLSEKPVSHDHQIGL